MAETRIANVVVPEIFSEYTMEKSIYRSRFFQSSILQADPMLNNLLAGGGKTFNVPFWQDVDNDEADTPAETGTSTVNEITADKQIAIRMQRERNWGTNSLARVLAGSNPLEAISERVVGYWARDYDKSLVSCVKGVIADNKANDSSSLVNATTAQFADDGVIDAQAKLGENGTVGSQADANNDYSGIAVHPSTYAVMRKLDLIDFVHISEQQRQVATYMGMEVIVDRNMPVNTVPNPDVYTSIIFKRGAFLFGQTDVGYTPTEIDRDPEIGFGRDVLYTRRVYCMHPVGTAFQSDTITGNISPSNSNLELAANWDRVFQTENMRFVAYEHTL